MEKRNNNYKNVKMLKLMPDNLLQRYGNICHPAAPRKLPRCQASNQVTPGDYQKPCKGKEFQGRVATAPSMQLFQKKHSASLYSPTSNGPAFSFPPEVLGDSGWAVMYPTCFPSCRGQARHQGLSALAVLIRSLPEVDGTSSGEERWGGGSRLLIEEASACGGETMWQIMAMTGSERMYYQPSAALFMQRWRLPRLFHADQDTQDVFAKRGFGGDLLHPLLYQRRNQLTEFKCLAKATPQVWQEVLLNCSDSSDLREC